MKPDMHSMSRPPSSGSYRKRRPPAANRVAMATAAGQSANKKSRGRRSLREKRRIPPERDALVKQLAKQQATHRSRVKSSTQSTYVVNCSDGAPGSQIDVYNLKKRFLEDEGVAVLVNLFFDEHESSTPGTSGAPLQNNDGVSAVDGAATPHPAYLIHLHQLNLSSNGISVAGAASISRMICSPYSMLSC